MIAGTEPFCPRRHMSPSRKVVHRQRRNEVVVERAIRCAEIVRFLSAITEELEGLADSSRAGEVDRKVDTASEALSAASVSVAELANVYARDVVTLFEGADCLAVRAAILSAKSARYEAKELMKRTA